VKYTLLPATFLVATLSAVSCNVFADGLSDLKHSLESLEGKDPLSALVESSYTEKRGKKKKKKKQKIKNGFIQVQLSDNQEGLKLFFSNETLNKLELESSAKEQDEEAKTPTLNAVDGVGVGDMRNMLSAAPNLLRSLKKATFIDEEVVVYQEQEVRQLNFTLPLEAIIENKEVHEYVDDFSGKFHILIDEQGIPIESKMDFTGSGSAYIFFSMDITQSRTLSYQVVGDRLINLKRSYQSKQSSTWGDTESEGTKTLVIQAGAMSLVSTNTPSE